MAAFGDEVDAGAVLVSLEELLWLDEEELMIVPVLFPSFPLSQLTKGQVESLLSD